MASSREPSVSAPGVARGPRRLAGAGLAALVAVATAGCAVGGDGEGAASGVVTVRGCGFDEDLYDLDPTFFGAQAFEDILNIQMQRGSDFQDRSDGVLFQVRDATMVRETLLDEPLPIEDRADALVQMSVYLNDSCPTDFTGNDRPVMLPAIEGTITFSAIFAPEADGDAREIEAVFEGAVLEDPATPDERRATLDGFFRFVFNRGRPAQRYP